MHARRSSHSALALVAVAAILPASALFGGQLNPPAGPIAPTMKPLSDVEPRVVINSANTPGDSTCVFKITQPGSYYLTANVTVPASQSGILVSASGVTIDLRGYAIIGQSGSIDGIADTASAGQAHIFNGFIALMGHAGLNGNSMIGSVISRVSARQCLDAGLRIPAGSTCESCTAQDSYIGITVNPNCTLRDCAASGCSNYGIGLDSGSTAENCTSSSNSGTGFRMFDKTAAQHCIARQNGGHGFYIDNFCHLAHCTATSNSSDGFRCGQQCDLFQCHSTINNSNGFVVDAYTRIRHCSAGGNGNACILLNGVFAACEDNNCKNGAYGIQASGQNCIVIRNVVKGASTANYQLAPHTIFGPIINAAASSASSVTVTAGGSAAGSFTTSDPNSNLSS